jgi:sterol desaturase/sphingolipid hydroxylase (fatty acid hydroxylase superfamily)
MQIALKDKVFNWIPPAMIVMALLFWSSGPAIVLNNPWTLTVVSSAITLLILGLERVHERHAGWRMNRQEFFTDLFYVILNSTVISWVANRLAEDPLTAAKASLGISTQWVMHMPWVVQAAMVLFLIEFGQYWMHRLMHNWHPFWLTHAPHHHITQLNAAKGAIGNPLELFLISLSVIALFDFDKTAMFAAFTAGSIISTFAHANVRSDPPRVYSFFFTTIRNHSLHHSVDYENTRCNYGNSLILLDRIFGTYREGEGVLVGQDERKRLSIKEQMLFPFQGPIDRFMAKRGNVQAGTDLPEMAQGDSPARETVGSAATA